MTSARPHAWRLAVAPLMDCTDRHCRTLHRLITRRTRLYTEMIATGALLQGDVARHLDFGAWEHPLALQLGGSEPAELARCAALAERWGYDEVNLNCGCPSERVQRGAFGACLMAEPRLVADCVSAMREATALPVTVKHRIGLGRDEHHGLVRDFVGIVAERGGCGVFIVHARNAWLGGLQHGISGTAVEEGGRPARALTPKENREIPPLRYETVYRLKADFPHLSFVLNGGLASDAQIQAQLLQVDGAMVGRKAYREPWSMAGWDATFFGESAIGAPDRDSVESEMVGYLQGVADRGERWTAAARHMLGLRHGQPGARHWRQVWSDPRLKGQPPAAVHRLAQEALRRAAPEATRRDDEAIAASQ